MNHYTPVLNPQDFPSTEHTARPPGELRLALATAVAVPGSRAMLIDADNHAVGGASINEAVLQDECFCVLPRDSLLILDMDKSWQREAFERICDRLREEDLRPVVLASGQPHRRHAFCVVPDPSLLRGLREEAHSAGIDTRSTNGARIRPPFTRHRRGLPVVLLEPPTAEEALDALSGAAWDPDVVTQPRLTQRTWRRLRYGDEEKHGSELVYSIACGAAAVGYPAEKLYRQLLDDANLGGEPLRSRVAKTPHKAERWFHRHVWPNAVKWVESKPTFENREDAIQSLMGMAEEIGDYAWESMDLPATKYEKPARIGGASMRRLLTFLVAACIEWGTVTPYVSRFYVCDEIGMDPKTVAKAFRGLELLGWLRLIDRGKGLKASTYQLLVNQERSNIPHIYQGVGSYVGEKSVLVHDAFQRGGGIGDSGLRLYSVMSITEGARVSDLARFARVKSVSYARKVLHNMAEVGLVRYEGRLWYAVEADLDAVAAKVGTWGKKLARKQKTDARRAAQRRNIEAWKREKQMERVVAHLRVVGSSTP